MDIVIVGVFCVCWCFGNDYELLDVVLFEIEIDLIWIYCGLLFVFYISLFRLFKFKWLNVLFFLGDDVMCFIIWINGSELVIWYFFVVLWVDIDEGLWLCEVY